MTAPTTSANANQLAQLAEHERIKRSTDLSLFYGNKKDTTSAWDWIDRFETASRIASWNEARKVDEFQQLLREEARLWWKALNRDFKTVDTTKWANVKAEFLKTYEVKYTAKTVCSNFKDLVQKPREPVRDYWSRVSEVFEKLMESLPADFYSVNYEGIGAANDEATSIKKEGTSAMSLFIQTQMFLAGLHEELRAKVMESGKTAPKEIYDYAVELEQIAQDKKSRTPTIAAIQDGATVASISPCEDSDDEELAAVNAIRARKGKPLLPRKPGPNAGQKKPIKCRYCKKMGHMQRECRSRIRDGAPMIGEDGKPYASQNQNKGVFAVEALPPKEKEPDIVGYSISSVQAMAAAASASAASLNW